MTADLDAQLYDVIVAGCGPVGATVANLLGGYGLSVLVVEKEIGVHPLPRAIHFDDEVMRIFQAIGLQREIAAATRPIAGMQFLDARGRLLLAMRKNEADLPLYGFPAANMFYQPALEEILRRGLGRFAHVHLLLGWRVDTFTQHDDGFTVTAQATAGEAAQTVRGRYLLACDGASSRVRGRAGLGLHNFHIDQPWLVVDTQVRASITTPSVVQQICDPARPVTFVPASGDRRRWEFMLLPGESAEAMTQPEQVRRLLASHIDPDQVRIERATVYTFHALLAERWQDRHLFLLGDAAHQMPPFLGQGMCAGIRDAHNLAWKLAMVVRGQATPDLLATYQRERRPHVARVIRLVRWAGGLIQTRRRWVAFLRDALLRAVTTIPPIRRRLRQLETVVPGLQHGCLDRGSRTAGRLFPQPPVQAADGSNRLLDDLLGDGFAVLTAGSTVPTLAAYAGALPLQHVHVLPPGSTAPPGRTPLSVVDRSGVLSQWCRRAGTDLIVLRPDRYVFGGYALAKADLALRRLAQALDSGLPAH